MKEIKQENIENLCIKISSILDTLQVPFLIYGSMAYFLYTNDTSTIINDIDIIVSDSRFLSIVKYLRKNNLEMNPVVTEFSIHVNHMQYYGRDKKAFDISLDSKEHYFKDFDIKLTEPTTYKLNGKIVKLLPKADLIEIYEKFSINSEDIKHQESKRKIKKLREK